MCQLRRHTHLKEPFMGTFTAGTTRPSPILTHPTRSNSTTRPAPACPPSSIPPAMPDDPASHQLPVVPPPDPALHPCRPGHPCPPIRPAVPGPPCQQTRPVMPAVPASQAPSCPAEPTSRDISAASAAMPLTRPALYLPASCSSAPVSSFPCAAV